jgi:hypothetical protein
MESAVPTLYGSRLHQRDPDFDSTRRQSTGELIFRSEQL